MPTKNNIESRIDSARRRLEKFSEACSFEKGGELTVAISDLQNLLDDLKELQDELLSKNTSVNTLCVSVGEEQKRYRELVEFAPYGYIVTDRDGIIKESNRAAAILLKTDYLPGSSAFGFFDQWDASLLMNGLGSYETEPFKKAEFLVTNRHGEKFPASVSIEKIEDCRGEQKGLRWLINDVTEKRRAEAEASRRQALLQGIMDNSRSVIYIEDPQGRYMMVNRQIELQSGKKKEEILGKTDFDFFPKEIAESLRANDLKVIETGAAHEFEERVIINGEERIELSNKFPILGPDGEIIAVCGISTDITQRKRAEKRGNHLNKVLRTFYEINHLIIHETDRSRLMQRVCDIFVKTGGFKIAVITSLDYQEGKVEPAAMAGVSGLSPAAFKACLKGERRESPLGRVLDKGEQAVCTGDKRAECMSAWGASELKDSCGSCAVYPIYIKGMVAGTLNLYSPEPDSFEGEVELMLARVAGNIGFALQTFEDLKTRREVEEALKKSEASLANAQRIAHMGSWVLDMQTDSVSWSDESYRIFGAPYGSALNFEMFMDAVHPEDRPAILKSIEQALTGKTISADFRIIRPDGEVRFLRSEGESCFDNEGKPLSISGIIYDITERKLAENALKESKARLDNAQRIAHIGSWDWNIRTGRTHWSDETWRIYGLEKKGKGEFDGLFLSLVHPDDRGAVFTAIQEALSGIVRYDIDFRIVRPDGEVRRIHSEGEVVYDADNSPASMSGVNHDITEKVLAEEALKEGEERFRQIFEQSEDAKLVFTADASIITDANPASVALFGFKKSQLVDSGPGLFINEGETQRLKEAVKSIHPDSNVFSIERMETVRKDGEKLIISVRGQIIRLKQSDMVYCTIKDITEMTRMAEESRFIQAKLIHANKMTSIGTLASGVAHEINNPNNFILFNSTLLTEAWGDAMGILNEYETENGDFTLGGLPFSEMRAVIPELLSGITDGARRIKGIVDNLKDFSRTDKSGMDGEVDVNRAVMASASILSAQISKYTDNFYVSCEDGLPQVRGSAQKIEQVIINLIINALHALPGKERCVWVSTSFDAAESQVRLTVRDEGVGMTKDLLERITEPFFTTKTDTGGTGLGLSISYSIIKEHRGFLEFESQPGKGTTVRVSLPAATLESERRYS